MLFNKLRKWFGHPEDEVESLLKRHPEMSTDAAVLRSLVNRLLDDNKSNRRTKLASSMFYFGMFTVPALLYFGVMLYTAGFRFSPGGEVVGVVRINGEISSESVASADNVNEALRQAFERKNVRAIVLSIDSLGGAPVEAERIYRTIDAYRKIHKKPVYAVINNAGASAAYMVAMRADKVYAAKYSLVGSIGAVMAGWDFHKALAKVDVVQRVYASGQLKGMMNPYVPMSDEANQKAQALVNEAGRQFVAELQSQRQGKLIPGFAYDSGAVWGGLEAKRIGLVDEIGTIDEIVKTTWNLPIYDVGPKSGGLPFFSAAAGWLKGTIREALTQPVRLY